MESRVCKVCHIKKPLEAFPRHYNNNRQGYRHVCLACRHAHSAAYYVANRESILVRQASHEKTNRIQVNARKRAYNADNPVKRLARERRYHTSHPEKNRAKSARYRVKHPDKVSERLATNRAMRRNVPIRDFTHAQWVELQISYDHRCAYCKKRCKGKLTQDHVTPLSQGGSHTLSNIVPACQSCNSKKRTGPPLTPVQPLLLTIALPKKQRGV